MASTEVIVDTTAQFHPIHFSIFFESLFISE